MEEQPQIVVVNQDGTDALPDNHPAEAQATRAAEDLTALVEEPAKVMRIGSMIRQLLDEV